LAEPLLHFAIPYSLSASRLGLRKALFLGLVALLPDADVLLRVHRSWTHSIIIVGFLSGAILFAVAVLKPKAQEFTFLCTLSLLSHLVLDLFQAYIPVLWPLLNTSFWLDVEVWITIAGEVIPQLSASINTLPTQFTIFTQLDAPIATSLGFITSLILVSVSTLTRIQITRLNSKKQKEIKN